jgi:diacylglycerol kinase family enzyme
VLPLGTVNVFAQELGLPARLEPAWETIQRGCEARIDLPWVEYQANGVPARRCFAQMSGAGLDARAIELVKWQIKKLVGPVAYVLAGLHAMLHASAKITANSGSQVVPGELVLIGNGRLYGGKYRLFPNADLRDGLLEVCVFPRVNWFTLARCSPSLLLNGTLPASTIRVFQSDSFTLTGTPPAPLQIDGEMIGHLPATFSIQPGRLRVIVPAS